MTLALSSRRAALALACGAVCGLAVAGAGAQTLPTPVNVVSLSASAAVEVPMDWLTVVFSTARDGADAGAVQSQLRQALDLALAEARKIARPGQVEVRTGGFSIQPRYAPPDARNTGRAGGIVGWSGSTELVVEGRDTAAISQLTGRIQTLSIARVGQSLSREAREQVEGEVSAQAIARFRARAEAVSKQFGFGGYTVREVNVGTDSPPPGMPMMRTQAMRAVAADEALPVEAGRATVTATVNGSVQMQK